MRIFIIGPPNMSEINEYISSLESQGHTVYYPARDTHKADLIGYRVYYNNVFAIRSADEIHIYYDPDNKESLFELGAAFASGKKLKIINKIDCTNGQSLQNMILLWFIKSAVKSPINIKGGDYEIEVNYDNKGVFIQIVCNGEYIQLLDIPLDVDIQNLNKVIYCAALEII